MLDGHRGARWWKHVGGTEEETWFHYIRLRSESPEAPAVLTWPMIRYQFSDRHEGNLELVLSGIAPAGMSVLWTRIHSLPLQHAAISPRYTSTWPAAPLFSLFGISGDEADLLYRYDGRSPVALRPGLSAVICQYVSLLLVLSWGTTGAWCREEELGGRQGIAFGGAVKAMWRKCKCKREW